jgi:hypothetical protein
MDQERPSNRRPVTARIGQLAHLVAPLVIRRPQVYARHSPANPAEF